MLMRLVKGISNLLCFNVAVTNNAVNVQKRDAHQNNHYVCCYDYCADYSV